MRLLLVVLAFIACFPSRSGAEDTKLIWGKVVAIEDGDTLQMVDDQNRKLRVQLAYIDAPDYDAKRKIAQPFYQESRRFLSKLVKGKEAIVESFGKDKFGKEEGIVFLDKLNVNVELLRRGMAEIYQPMRAYPGRYNQYYLKKMQVAEKLAKEEKTGVWANSEYVSPYQFRRRNKP